MVSTPVSREGGASHETSEIMSVKVADQPGRHGVREVGHNISLRAHAGCLKKSTAGPLSGGQAWGFLCPVNNTGKPVILSQRQNSEDLPRSFSTADGYLIGTDSECDVVLHTPGVSSRYCLIFCERGPNGGALLQDISSHGTVINQVPLEQNQLRRLADGDLICIENDDQFIFRYPPSDGHDTFLDKYDLIRPLGSGHLGSVLECSAKSSGKHYAVKTRVSTGSIPNETLDDFHHEIATLSSLNHPSLLRIRDSFHERDATYLVTDLALKGDLFSYVSQKARLGEGETRHIFNQLFRGVQYLHERNIVHCDIKPENILLTDDKPTVRLADFDLSRTVRKNLFTTTQYGTPSYSAPEVFGKPYRRYSRSADIWSLGVVLYICLCGFPPFSEELNTPGYPYGLIEQIRQGMFDYPSPYWDEVKDDARCLIDHMLSVDMRLRADIYDCLKDPWTRGQSESHLMVPNTTRKIEEEEDD